MIIKISRSGGFAGIEEEIRTVDTRNLSPERNTRIENGLAKISQLLAENGGNLGFGADMLHYEIDIQDNQGKDRKLTIVDDGDPTSPLNKAFQELMDASN